MRKFISLCATALLSMGLWAAETTMPTTGSYSNATTKYELANSTSTISNNTIFWACRSNVTVAATGLRPNTTGLFMQVTGATILTFNVKSGTTSSRSITGQLYEVADELYYVWKNTTTSTETLEAYVIAVNAKAAGERSEEEAAIAAHSKLKTITGNKDANKRMLIGETADNSLVTAVGDAINHACPTTNGGTNSFSVTLPSAGKYLLYLTSSGGSIGITSIDANPICTVTINPNGGSYASTPTGWTYDDVNDVYTKSGLNGNFDVPDGITKENNALVGWQNKLGSDIELPIKLSKDTTLIAQWEAVSCPSGLTISGGPSFEEHHSIELTAALEEGNGEITYKWYKGEDLETAKTAGVIGTGKTYTKAACEKLVDAGNYFCVAKKSDCSDAESSAFAVTITDYVCPTSGAIYSLALKSATLAGVEQDTEVALAGDYAIEDGGISYLGNINSDATKAQITTTGGGTVYFNGNDAYVKIELYCSIHTGDTLKFVNGDGSKQLDITKIKTRAATYYTASNEYIFGEDFDDVDVIYLWRKDSGASYLHSLTITRPKGGETSLDNTTSELNAIKRIENGQLIIEKNGVRYNALGQTIR